MVQRKGNEEMSTLICLFGQRGREIGKATQKGRRRAHAGFVSVLAILVLALAWLGGEAQAQSTVIATISFGSSRAGVIGANPVTNKVYAAREDDPSIAVIDGNTNTVITTIPTAGFHVGLAVNPHTNRIYVSQQFAGAVRVINGSTDTVITDFAVPGLVHTVGDVAVNPATNRIYVVRADNQDISVHDGVTHAQLATVSCAGTCHSGNLAVNPATNRIYVTNPPNDTVTVVDGVTNMVITTISVGDHPVGVDVNSVTNLIYVTNVGGSTLSVIDGAKNTVVDTVAVGTSPLGVGVNHETNRIYVANLGSDTVSIIDGATNTIVETVPVVQTPAAVAVIPSTSRVYVAKGDRSVSVIEDLIPLDATPPVVNVSFPSTDGLNGWFVTSPVVGSVTADDTTTGGSNITDIICTGATLGSITGLGTPSATASLTVSAEGVNNISCTATDNVGNSGASTGSSNTATIQLDSVAPAVLIASPADGGSYLLNEAMASSYNCTDATSGVATCSGPVVSGVNFSTSSVGAHAFTVTASDVAGNLIQATNDYDVIYNFSGFFSPVDNPGPGPTFVFNVAKAGSAIPVKFSLSGDQGLNIFAAGYPKSDAIQCDSSAQLDGIEETVTAGSSSLSYDLATDTYTYVWKTNKTWANTCRQLVLKLNDGTFHRANFKFTK